MDLTGLNQIVSHKEFKSKRAPHPEPIKPLNFPEEGSQDLFEVLKEQWK